MQENIADLIRISTFAGSTPLLVQGGGGNGSVKDIEGKTMWIKASGLRMAAVEADYGYVELQVESMNAITRDADLAKMDPKIAHDIASDRTRQLATGALRPSMETGFHALLGRVVLHTHSVYINAFTCLEGGEAALKSVSKKPILWINYLTPGYALSVDMDQAIANFAAEHGSAPDAIFLANHGFISSADTAEKAIDLTHEYEAIAKEYFGPLADNALDTTTVSEAATTWAEQLSTALRARDSHLTVRAASFLTIVEAANHPELLASGALIPDDVIYSGDTVFVTEGKSPEAWFNETFATNPDKFVVVVPGTGVFIGGPEKALDATEENLLAHVLVRQLVARRGTALALAKSEVLYLQSMENEKYRQAIAAGKIGGK